MLSCIRGRQCDQRALKFENGHVIEDKECGSNLAYAYFVSFIFLCSFLVRLIVPFFLDSSNNLNRLIVIDVELVRGRHYGQLWLPNTRLVHSWRPSFGRVYQNMGRIRPQRNVRLPYFLVVYKMTESVELIRCLTAGKFSTRKCSIC